MKRSNVKRVVVPGVVCALACGGSVWHAVTCNESRLVAPMDLSTYTFRVQDLPMWLSGSLFVLYVFYLFGMMVGAIRQRKEQEKDARITRRIHPALGSLGFLGFLGILGFWTYGVDKTVFPFMAFMFFGFFGFFYEGKMSGTLKDERYMENRQKAQAAASRIALTIICVAAIVLCQGRFLGNLEYTLIALILVIAFATALFIFLGEYLLYCYDKGGQDSEDYEDGGEE